MYHVISTGIAVTILYLICYFFYRAGFFGLADHRKIWNIILAITFIVTAVAGLILALKVTYKWQNTFFTALLKWHVETGIAFSFSGIIHLAWHYAYFRDIFKVNSRAKEYSETASDGLFSKQFAVNLFFIGYLSSSVQILLMREMLNLSGGYELITGTFLASWLISSAAGSFYAGRSKINDLKKLNTFFAISPLLSLALMIIISRLYLNPGETPTFFASILFTLLVLFPICFLSGFVFIKVLTAAKNSNIYSSGKSFSIETTGGIAAGLSVTLLSSGILNTYQILLLSIVIYSLFVVFAYYRFNFRVKFITVSTAIILILIFIWINPDRFFRQLLLRGIKVENTKDTPYGNITAGKYGQEKYMYYNQRVIRWRYDEIEREENIHYAMLQHKNPEAVLLVSGDPASNIKEIMKYGVKKIYFVERDPELIKTFASENIPGDITVETVNTDAYTFIRRTDKKFDIIIMVLPPPSTLLLNRYYTKDFFENVKSKLNDGGIFSCSPGSAENYYNYQSASLYSVIYNTLASVFKNIIPIAGNKLFFIASDGHLSTEICMLLENKGIKNIYVSKDYLNDDLIKLKSDEILSVIDHSAKVNTISRPVACFHFQSYNLTKDLGKILPSIVIMVILFVLPVFIIKPGNFPMYGAAASLAGYEILTLMAIQSVAGNIYHLTGLVIAVIMAGLSLGAWAESLLRVKNQKLVIMCILLLFYLFTFIIFNKIIVLNSIFAGILLFLVLSFIPSFFTGSLFKVMTEGKGENSGPSGVYGSDLAGSSLGFIAISGITIPLAGTAGTLLIISALILIGLIFAMFCRKL